MKKRVRAYFDGSNFYNRSKQNYGVTKIDFNLLIRELLKNDEELDGIKYFIAPVNRQEAPIMYKNQQRFFSKLRKYKDLKIVSGKLVSRPINKINIQCKCGKWIVEELGCPNCGEKLNVKNIYKSNEKGVDVALSTHLLLDAINDNYDVALLFSHDADFCPAINYIINKLKKQVVFCAFPNPKVDELRKYCSEVRKITKNRIEKAIIRNRI